MVYIFKNHRFFHIPHITRKMRKTKLTANSSEETLPLPKGAKRLSKR